MTTITDTSILNWLPFDETGGEVWRLALVNSESQNWNVTDPTNSTTTLAMTAAARHGTSSSLFASPAHLGLATGLLLSLVLNSRIWTAKANKEVFGTKTLFGASKPYQWVLHLTPTSSFTFASTKTFILPYLYLLPLLAMVFLLPILSLLMAFLLPFAMYRFAIHMYLQYRSNTNCKKKLFSGADAVWTFNESYESYSVINALIILEGEPQIEKLRRILTARLGPIPKLRMRHNFTLGYATWYEDKEMDLGSLVQWIPESSIDSSKAKINETNLCDDERLFCTKWNRKNLSKIVESLCNVPLPKNHTVGWEALVGKAKPWEELVDDITTGSDKDKQNHKSTTEETISQIVFPILFRIHHSVGDGASLLQLLMSALIDDDTFTSSPLNNDLHVTNLASLSRPLTLNTGQNEVYQKEREISNIDFTHVLPEKSKCLSHIDINKPKERTSSTCHLVTHSSGNKGGNSDPSNMSSTPIFHNVTEKIISESKSDKESSFLYGRRLSGKKTILWDSTSVSVEEIKKIRLATGVKFTEILLSAVSAALSNYWEARETGQLKMGKDKKEIPPSSVKLVLPAILGSLFQKKKDLTIKDSSELENLFSVAVMTLPVGKGGGCPLERLSKVSDASGYMMPLRKDSIVDCGMKMNLKKEVSTNQGSENTKVMNKSPPTTHQDLRNATSSAKVSMPEPTQQRISNEHSIGKKNLKIASITPSEPEILTYYYTKEPEVQVKLAQDPDTSNNRNFQVQYHKYLDSTKVILHEKEPYHCPTTIFFTQNTHKTIGYDSTNKCNPGIDDECSESLSLNKTRNENYESSYSTVKYPDVLTLKKVNMPTEIKEDITNMTPEAVKNHEVTKSNATPPTSINFPSSPTIQHLLTRWLALDIVATVLPSLFAAPMMKIAAKGVAVVMSNLPGPPKKLHSILGGHALKDIVFWAPHRGYTGLGITVLSYDGMLHIGVMADEAVIPTEKGVQLIMDTILDELHSLRAAASSSH